MPNYFDPSQMATPGQPDLSLLGNARPNFSLGTRIANVARPLLGNQDLALALLSNSGYSPQKRSLGEIFGTSALQAQQMGQQRQDDAFKQQYQMAQLANMKNGSNIYGAVQPDKFTPESLAQFEKTRKYSDLKLRPIGMQTGRYNPGDFTPESWSEFLSTNDPGRLVRYVTPQNATVEQINGAPTVVQPDKTGKTPPRVTQLNTPEQERAAAAELARQKAMGEAEGAASGGQSAKAPAQASFNSAIANMRSSIAKTPQGRFAGPIGNITAYGDKKLFDSRAQQLSTELRTVFRIAGEGTLSDQEQKQYGFQLPSADNPPDVNEQILQDLEKRVTDRINTPVGNAPAKPVARRRYNPATGKIE